MLEIKIVIAPVFQFCIQFITERCTGIMRALMPMPAIIVEPIVGGKIETAAKPPDRIFAGFFCTEETHIGMCGWYEGIVRMKHQRDAHGAPFATSKLRSLSAGAGRQGLARDFRKTDASLFKQCTVGQCSGQAATAFSPLPGIITEFRLAIQRF